MDLMDPKIIAEGVTILALGSAISYAAKRLLTRREDPGREVKRRRRRHSFGRAEKADGASFEIEDISLTGALLRTKGLCHLRLRQSLDLELEFSDGSRASVRAIVVRMQRPSWRKGLIGGVGISFRYNGEEDPNKLLIENFVAAGSS